MTPSGAGAEVTFADLGLPDALTRSLAAAGITAPFPIQAATVADALAGSDVLGKARTGSGKTLAFGLPTIARLADAARVRAHRPQAIVLVPTRELAIQVHDALEPLAHTVGVSIKLVAGGLSMPKQIAALERGTQLVIATPGRLADLVRRGHADTSSVQVVVLDEADHMAEMGFMTEIEEILADVPSQAQHLLFSATLDGDVDRLVSEHMHSPVLHDVTGDAGAPDMQHVVFNISPHLKYQVASRIAAREGRTIVFVRTKMACDRIAAQLRESGIRAVALHGDKDQHERNAAVDSFRSGKVPVLVATDVAARGIHIDDIDLVLQLDPPGDAKDYTHRAGRTARAGATGLVVTLALPHQRKAMDRVVDETGLDLLFRKVREADEDTLAMIDALTGGREPSGRAVSEPKAGRARDEEREPRSQGGRTARDGRGRGRGSSDHGAGGRDRSGRDGAGRDRSGRDRAGRGASERASGERGGPAGAKAPRPGAKKNGPQRADSKRQDPKRGATRGDDSRDDSRRAQSRDSEARGGEARSGERQATPRRERQPNPNPRKRAPGTKKSAPAPTRGRKGKPRPKKKR